MELVKFIQWYLKHFLVSISKVFSLQKSIGEWLAFAVGGLGMLALFFDFGFSDETKQNLIKVGASVLIFILCVFGPIWYAYQESLAKDEEIKKYEESLASPVHMDDVRLDARYHTDYKIVEMRVKNNGPNAHIARVYAVGLEDTNRNRIERIDEPIELHWRGAKEDIPKVLAGDIDAIAGIMQIHIRDPEKRISLMGKSTQGFVGGKLIPLLTEPIAHCRSEELLLMVRVVFFKDGSPFKTKQRRIRIKPDSAAEIGYHFSMDD